MFDTKMSIITKNIFRLLDYASVQISETCRRAVRRRGMEQAKFLTNTVSELKLDLGCGSLKRPGFIGIDLSSKADLQWDINWGIPFNDNSVTEIRSDHFFEHLELSHLMTVFRECRRVL